MAVWFFFLFFINCPALTEKRQYMIPKLKPSITKLTSVDLWRPASFYSNPGNRTTTELMMSEGGSSKDREQHGGLCAHMGISPWLSRGWSLGFIVRVRDNSWPKASGTLLVNRGQIWQSRGVTTTDFYWQSIGQFPTTTPAFYIY